LNWIVRLLFLLIAGAVLLMVLLVSLVGLAFSLLRWLLTGQKPQIAMVFETYRAWQQRAAQQIYPRHAEDVIEAEVRVLPPSDTDKP
jgi:hypothetical protein